MSQLHQLRKGSTPLLILNVLSDEKMYGYQIMRELERRSDGYFTMTAALLYPALHDLEQEGLVESEWEGGSGRRKRKYYTITARGRTAFQENHAEWRTFVDSLFKTLQGPHSHLEEAQE